MIAPARRPRYTYTDYIHVEEVAHVKHEYFDGEIYAMAGGTPEHAALCANVIAALAAELRGRPCRVHTSDLRVRILATGLATYPDVAVICDRAERDSEDPNAVLNPVFLCEVLSPTTEDYDRGEKLENYKRIPALRAVALVSHDARRIEVFSRQPDGTWSRTEVRAGGRAPIASLGCELDVDEIYRDPLKGEWLV